MVALLTAAADALALLPQQAVDAEQVFAACPAGHFLDCTQDLFLALTEQWLQRALNLAQGLFLALATLELVVSGWVYWTRKDQGGSDFVGTLAVKLGVLAFVLGVITSYAHWAPLIPFQLGLVATEIGGKEVAELSVTGILHVGWRMSWAIFAPLLAPAAATAGGVGLLGGAIAAAVTAIVSSGGILAPAAIAAALATMAALAAMACVIFACFASIAIQLLTTMIEAYVVITSGFVFVGMAAFRGTAPFTGAYLRYVVYVAVKLFCLILICGGVLTAGNALIELLVEPGGAGHNLAFGENRFTGAFAMVAAVAAISLLFLELVKRVPEELASHISSSMSVDIKGVLKQT